MTKTDKISDYFREVPILPILQVSNAGDGVLAAKALKAGGLNMVEVVLRTRASLEVLEEIRRAVPDMIVGAGTIISPELARNAKDAGAQYLVSPGSTPHLLEAMLETGLPSLPAIASASDIIMVRELGFWEMKFFPASINGGVTALKVLGSVFSEVSFCPTGGVNQENAPGYLALDNVFAVGGSWLLSEDNIRNGNWQTISRLAQQVVDIFSIVR